MTFTTFGRLTRLRRASDIEPYWWHYDKSGNRARSVLAIERCTARGDGLVMWRFVAGPWELSIEGRGRG